MDHKTILSRWGLEFKRVLNITIQGSPERSIFRSVVEDNREQRYVVEEISVGQKNRRETIAQVLSTLKEGGMSVEPYLKTTGQGYVADLGGRYYQVARFVEGKGLPRPGFALDQWRGSALAAFLIDMRKLKVSADKDLDMRLYVNGVMATMRLHHPQVHRQTLPVIAFLDNGLFRAIDSLPTSFCHGDYHPINVIWGEEKLLSVIDWEFCGAKPELYDAANMIGCVGMENPKFLTRGLVTAFITELRKGDYPAVSWEYLVDLIVANRFAWLSEWCRKDDREMQTLEAVYMKLLIDSKSELMSAWQI
jgi:homoserine kinase type II